MAQLNLYVPDELAESLRNRAASAGVPLSRFVVSLITRDGGDAWPPGYFDKTCGFLREPMDAPEDPAPEPVEGIE